MRDWLSGRTYAETAARANTVDAIRAQIDRLARAEIERLENLAETLAAFHTDP